MMSFSPPNGFFIEPKSRIYLAGHTGLVGSAIHRRLLQAGYSKIITRTHHELNLMRQSDVERFFAEEKPEYVILAAAKVGGIYANSTYPAQFLFENLSIQNNVIHTSWLSGIKKLVFLGSACSYPRECPQPIKEEFLLTGALEPTNEPYAIAKIAGIKLCQAYNHQYGTCFICAVPTNAYGPNDNFDPEDSHVIPALLQKFHDARAADNSEVTIWGTGAPLREFIFADDLADAVLFLLQHYEGFDMVNVGTEDEISTEDLARLIKDITGFKGGIRFDRSKPDGMPRKTLDKTRLFSLGWRPRVSLRDGLRITYQWFQELQDVRERHPHRRVD
ncbi:MAG TPA: GDP-L-fucose synthase [Smithellaceae bacterium]|nr:GDP-L-fucose synthase [Smithellaceae bacterium]